MNKLEEVNTSNQESDIFLTLPFSTKGHFHIPNGIAAVLMDVLFTFNRFYKPSRSSIFLPFSWNLHGKYITKKALTDYFGFKSDSEEEFFDCLSHNLPEVLLYCKRMSEANLIQTKRKMLNLKLHESGIYQGIHFKPYEFRDDSLESQLLVQKFFIECYKEGLIYLAVENNIPCFYLKIKDLYKAKSFESFIKNYISDSFVIKVFENNFKNYIKDIPVSCQNGYATPVPLIVDQSFKINFPSEQNNTVIDPRLSTSNCNHLLCIKPLINVFKLLDVLQTHLDISFGDIYFSNDADLITRIDFMENLISNVRFNTKNLILFKALLNENGNKFSFKKNIILEFSDYDELPYKQSFIRYLILKNTKLGAGKTIINNDIATFKNIIRLYFKPNKTSVSNLYSKYYKKEVDINDTVKQQVKRKDVGSCLSFLIDLLFQQPDNGLPKKYLNMILKIE